MKITDNYLYEIIEEYKEATSIEKKDEILHLFCDTIWGSNNKRKISKKLIKFYVKDDLIDSEIGRIFNNWSCIEYKICKFITDDDGWCSLIRQKINNLYSIYFDKELIFNKEYLALLKTPKRLYYKWLEGQEFSPDALTASIEESINTASLLYDKYQKQKMVSSWDEYKIIINGFLKKIFDNCKLIDEYQDEYETKISIYQDFMTEDNFYIKYICKCLESYMRNYQKEYYGLQRGRNKKYKRCKECGALIENTGNKRMYCEECALIKEKNRKKQIAYKYRKQKIAK